MTCIPTCWTRGRGRRTASRYRWIRWTAPLLAGIAVGTVAIWAVWGLLFPLLAIILVEAAIGYFLRKPIHEAITTVESAFDDLKGLSVLFKLIEAQRFEAAHLVELQRKLSSHSLNASAALSKLATIVNFVEARRNPILTPFLLLLMYPLQTALAAERWRSIHGAVIHSWLEVLGELEALLSLAPLLLRAPLGSLSGILDGPPPSRRRGWVTRSSRRSRACAMTSPSKARHGSSWSAARTCPARAPCCAPWESRPRWPWPARRLRDAPVPLTPLQVGASIRVNDSLYEGSSRFYAEITRLRQTVRTLSRLPLVFLLDELLQGTNSTDRRIGAQGVLRALLERGAIGLISTHDLAISEGAWPLPRRTPERPLPGRTHRRQTQVRFQTPRRHRHQE